MKIGINRILSQMKGSRVLPSIERSNKNEDLQMEIRRENLRQAITSFDMSWLSFKIALVAIFASTVTGLVGSGLLLAGKISEGTLTTCISTISGTYFYQICKEAQERAEKANNRLSTVLKELESDD